jgi:hypothetical protein
MYFGLVGDGLDAFGHPSACTEPKGGSVVGNSIVSVDGSAIAAESTCTLDFSSHGHATDDEGNCTSYSSHSITQDQTSTVLTINGNEAYLNDSSVDTDPGSGGSIDYTSALNEVVSVTE